MYIYSTSAAAKSLQSCPTLCNPVDGSPPGSPVPEILQARTLEWIAISFSNVWKWKWSRSVVSDSSRPNGLQPTRLLRPWDFPGKSTGVGCHCLLRIRTTLSHKKTRKAARSTSLLPPPPPAAADQTEATSRRGAALMTQRAASVTQARSFRDTTASQGPPTATRTNG